MENRLCKHTQMIRRNSWEYCADCGEIFIQSMCAHEHRQSQCFWVRCTDCGAALLNETEAWITSKVQLTYLDFVAKSYDASFAFPAGKNTT